MQSLRKLLIERLALMEQVAAYKWNENHPIDDPAREANVLKATLARAQAAGLAPADARRLIEAQMEAAKMVQRRYFAIWRAEKLGPIADVPDLAAELRPKIGGLSGKLIDAVADSRDKLNSCDAVSVLRPVPQELSYAPEAWETAVAGVLAADANCP